MDYLFFINKILEIDYNNQRRIMVGFIISILLLESCFPILSGVKYA